MEWANFKAVADSLGISIQIKNEGTSFYELILYNGPHTFECHLPKDGGADHTDFETNYLPNANQPIEARNLTNPFASNVLPDGKVLYLKIHGQRKVVPANGQIAFELIIPYTEAYLQGLEIFQDVLSQTDMGVEHPLQPGVFVEQYGFDVCMGKVIYEREAQYASRLPQGLIIKATVKNSEAFDQEFGVNFILHEIRDV